MKLAGAVLGLVAAIAAWALFVGFVAMLTFGAIANEFGLKDAPGFVASIGIAAGLSFVLGTTAAAASKK